MNPTTDVLVTLCRELTSSAILSHYEFEDLNQFVFKNMLEVNGHAKILSRLAFLYHMFRPTLPIEMGKKFWAHIANALERDFDVMPCKFLNYP